MNLLKSTLIVSSLLAISSASFAGGMMTAPKAQTDTLQWGVSLLSDNNFSVGAGIDLQNQKMEAGLNIGGGSISLVDDTNFSEVYYGGYVGLRTALMGNVHAAGGFLGAFESYSGNTPAGIVNTSPYKVGAYVALEYQPNQNFQAFVRAMPYSYNKTSSNTTINNYFQDCQLGVKYFLN